jgi:hypothetical protein
MPKPADIMIRSMAPIRRASDERQEIEAEVYAPNTLDTYGEYMSAEDIAIMAHRFMELDLKSAIDVNHDNQPTNSVVRESYIARAGDPDFTEGAWVLKVHVPDPVIWASIKSGDLNCYSFEAMVRPRNDIVTVSTIRDHVGRTKTSEDADHEHTYFVQVDEAGLIKGGYTSEGPDGHTHKITRASFTDTTNGHSHRYDLF